MFLRILKNFNQSRLCINIRVVQIFSVPFLEQKLEELGKRQVLVVHEHPVHAGPQLITFV